MKNLLLLSLLVVSMAFANSVVPCNYGTTGTETLVDIPWDFNEVANGLQCNSADDRFAANDFKTTDVSTIEETTIWIISAEAASSIDVLFYDGDDTSGPGSLLDVVPCSFVLTEAHSDGWGWIPYECAVTFASSYTLVADTHYWMTFNPVGGFFYWLVEDYDGTWGSEGYFTEDGGSSWSSTTDYFDQAYEGFWVLESTTSSTIEETTWGQIKGMNL